MIEAAFLADFEYYKVFYYVTKFGTLTAAAKHLCLTQPTVTAAIQKLEEQLRCTLFIRTKRGVELTQEGRILWDRVEPACQLLLSAEQELSSIPQLGGGILSISATEMSFITYVLPALERFMKDYPQVKVKFKNMLTQPVAATLQNGDVDLAILHMPFPHDEKLVIREIGEIHECFVVGSQLRYLAKEEQTVETLSKYPLISVIEGSATKRFASQLFSKYGLEYEPDIEVTTIELVIKAVMHNFGIAMLPREHIENYLAEGKLFEVSINEAMLVRTACVLTHRDIPLRPAARVFLEHYLNA